MTILIRPATLDDAEGIFTAHQRSIRELCAGDYSAEELDAWMPATRSPEKYRNDIKAAKKSQLVAEIDGIIAGFTYYSKGNISACYVHPDFVRRGVAKALFQAVENDSLQNGVTRITLSSSITALPFYQKMGMRQMDESTHRFENGVEVPVMKMQKNLF